MSDGQNLPGFTDAQLAFSAHIRNPEVHPRPADIEARRMDIYVGLFYRNIENFLLSAFPVLRSCLEAGVWDSLVREFVHIHSSESPFFLEISQEFLTFLDHRGLQGLPPFALELAHYEWVELALDVAEGEVKPYKLAADQPLPKKLATSALAIPLSYRFDVHQIGPEHQPETPSPQGCFLLALRDDQDSIKFVESSPLTHRLLDLLQEQAVGDAVNSLFEELTAAGMEVTRENVASQVDSTVRQLLEQQVLVGIETELKDV